MSCARFLVFVVTGHGLKAPGYWDPGAVFSISGYQEAKSVRVIASEIKQALEVDAADEVEVIIDEDGHYFQRHARLAAIEDDFDVIAVVHLHHNSSASPNPHYAATMFDHRSGQGEALSRLVADQLASVPGAPWGDDVKVIKTYDDRGKAKKPWLYRAFGCIDEVFNHPANVSATLIEYGFISHPDTDRWFFSGEGVAPSARATARGVLAWLRQRAAELGK